MILIPVSVGELIDKITILQIKQQRITDAAKHANVEKELALLRTVAGDFFGGSDAHAGLQDNLLTVNERLWDIENAKRQHEADKNFDAGFIRLARDVYILNDRRAALKRQINDLCGSEIIEEKSHAAYEPPSPGDSRSP